MLETLLKNIIPYKYRTAMYVPFVRGRAKRRGFLVISWFFNLRVLSPPAPSPRERAGVRCKKSSPGINSGAANYITRFNYNLNYLRLIPWLRSGFTLTTSVLPMLANEVPNTNLASETFCLLVNFVPAFSHVATGDTKLYA